MPNMSYCRFRNTLQDLDDCYEHWEDLVEEETEDEVRDDEEIRARERILELCEQIVQAYSEKELD